MGETFAKAVTQHLVEDADFADEKETEIEEEYSEAVLKKVIVEISGNHVGDTHFIFSSKQTEIGTNFIAVAGIQLFLLHCQIIR